MSLHKKMLRLSPLHVMRELNYFCSQINLQEARKKFKITECQTCRTCSQELKRIWNTETFVLCLWILISKRHQWHFTRVSNFDLALNCTLLASIATDVSNTEEDFLRVMKAMRNGKRRLSERWKGSCTNWKRRIAWWLLNNSCGAWLLGHILRAENWE